MRTVLSAMRVEQWYKNFVIFIGIVFSMNLTNLWMLSRIILAFGVFCVLSSSVYIINDIHDVEEDRLHPRKRNRSITSGRMSLSLARILVALFIVVSLASAFILGSLFFVVCLIYLVQNFLYTFWLRSLAVVDVVVVSVGFVWRAIAGTVVIGVDTSPWLIICSFLLALFLALIKRRTEMTVLEQAEKHRATLGSYSKQLIDTFLNITTASLLVAYMIYTFNSKYIYMMATIPFSFIGIFRYLQLAREQGAGDDAPLIFRDGIIQVNLFLWSLTSIIAIYGFPEHIIEILTRG